MKHEPREEALQIANTIAEVGAERALNLHLQEMEASIEALDNELATQQEVVAEKRKTFEDFQSKSRLQSETHTQIKVVDLSLEENILREMIRVKDEVRALLTMPREPITIHQRAR